MEMAVSNVDGFLNSSMAKMAVTGGIANHTGVPNAYVDVDLSAVAAQRRLRVVRQLGEAIALRVTYVISVDGAAPSSVAITGTEVASKLMATNAGAIQNAISSRVNASMAPGSALYVVSLKVNEPNVLLKSPPQSSTSETTTSASGATEKSSSTTTKTITHLSGDPESGVVPMNSGASNSYFRMSEVTAVCMMVILFFL